jgi:hypothetical protein
VKGYTAMKKITCVGYHATGSGAVDDFLREFDNIKSARYGFECRFLQDPDGISDLEYNLIENPHRLNSGFALKRFMRYATDEKRTYRQIFGEKWLLWVESYIASLSNFTFKGYWHADLRIISPYKMIMYNILKAINLLLPKSIKYSKYHNYFPDIKTHFTSISGEDFIKITQEKCEELCELMNLEKKEFIVLDQAVSPQNLSRYLRYITELKVIIVDRDPRDVYINDVIINDDFTLPKDIHKFCEIYQMSRCCKNAECYSDDQVMKINFEDLIYRYEPTTESIMQFIGLKKKNWFFRKHFFKPEESYKNTRLWENVKFKKISDEIADELSEYLYNYENIPE